jgi:hypothetical protein
MRSTTGGSSFASIGRCPAGVAVGRRVIEDRENKCWTSLKKKEIRIQPREMEDIDRNMSPGLQEQ